ncbi:DUF533 domain-containing protein [Pseudoprimorskyibacter insulae]|uniref:Inner membrane protein YebE n=1 Tax=Pseudoprimorskyibacter insulae TaxID=1695997 RepID=A0A2R8AVZ3_9RHOB|nr:DUF533 domain-containing protein [Pseudoprimorskyibacter insulae]SPF80205.1 hypothetical protein PRI8871_02011 [Pseudoprimorskyibacter insulae]
MSLISTLTKVALGYAAARGVDKLSGGGLQGLLGGGAQVPASDPMAKNQADMVKAMSGDANPMQGMMDKLGGFDPSAMMGALGGAGNPMAEMMQKMQDLGGVDLSALMGGKPSGDKGGLLSSMPDGGAGMAGMLAAAGGAAAMGGKSVEGLLDQFKGQSPLPDSEQMASLALRAMIQAAKADGTIDEAEKVRILDTVGDADAEDIAFIEDQLNAKVDIAGLAADTPEPLKAQVYSASLMTIRVDTEAEAAYLNKLAKALDLPETAVNMLHLQMGVKPLYA